MVSFFIMNNKITVIEGPTPEFQIISNTNAMEGSLNWVGSVLEGPFLYDTAFTNLRTFDSQKLMDRCLENWQARQTMYLEYRDRLGLRREDPIIAARAVTVEEGDMLLLWVRRELVDEDENDLDDSNDSGSFDSLDGFDDDIPF